ncbi:13909_t:CDS:2 [Funneliformis geosporum]|uniref:13909_t:CDS:1 n=1 Tax=Funneliformis geosporum TaxID=1117311 RepID=A0A9W4SY58_9GLOM|nr:13909_t:CDS:2 [Funneliformis geosporum]
MRDPGLCNQNSLTLTLQIEEKNLDSKPFITDISSIESQDSIILLNEKDGQDVYLASLSSESYVASSGFKYSKEGKVPYKQKVEKV